MMSDSKGRDFEFESAHDSLDNSHKVSDTKISDINQCVVGEEALDKEGKLDMTRKTSLQPLDDNIPIKMLHPMYIVQP